MTDDQIREATAWVVAACDRRFAGDRGPLERRLAYPGEMAKLLRTLERDASMRARQQRGRGEAEEIPDAVWALVDVVNGMPTLERQRTMGKVARDYWRHHRPAPAEAVDQGDPSATMLNGHMFQKEYQGESDAKRRPARCRHCGQDRTDPAHSGHLVGSAILGNRPRSDD